MHRGRMDNIRHTHDTSASLPFKPTFCAMLTLKQMMTVQDALPQMEYLDLHDNQLLDEIDRFVIHRLRVVSVALSVLCIP